MKKILIVRTDRVGDVIMITPMIRELRLRFPDSFIATLTQPYTAEILANNPYLDTIITDDLKKENFWTVVKELWKYKFTDALLVLPTERAAYQLFFAGIKNRIGVGRKLYEVITLMKSVSRNNYVNLRHEADYCMDLARKIGVVTNNVQPEIFLSDKEKEDAEKFLVERRILPGDFKLVIHTGSRGSAPNWSEGKYLSLIEKIFETFDTIKVKLFLTAVEMSDDFIKKVKGIGGEKIIDVSKELTNLRELIRCISKADLFVCSSTGPIHIADALNIRCIGIHCHRPMSSAKIWGVINKKSINLEVSEENCKKYCSADQNTCGIEHGLGIEEVINSMRPFMTS
jgi:heptosyltransferase-2